MTDVREAELLDALTAPVSRGEVVQPAPKVGRGALFRPGAIRLPGTVRIAKARWRPILSVLLCISPTLLAAGYYGMVASGRYVSHAVFLVRTASKPSGDSGLGAFLSMAGLGRAEDDTFTVQNFLQSRDALRRLQTEMPVAEIYGRDGIDLLSRYPSVLYGSSNEDLFRFYKRMTLVTYNTTTGLTSLDAEAFRPDDALQISRSLLAMSEDLVNEVNARIHQDAVGSAEAEVKHQEARLTDAQVAITSFQNRETMIDPITNSVMVSEIVGKLQTDLAQELARIADMSVASPNNPSLPVLLRQAEVTRQQIAREQERVTSAKEGLADKLGQYQRLTLEREFATKALGVATTSLDSARAEARRKQLYIERVVEPELSDMPTLPQRGWTVFTVAMVNILALFVGWVIKSGVKEHVSSVR